MSLPAGHVLHKCLQLPPPASHMEGIASEPFLARSPNFPNKLVRYKTRVPEMKQAACRVLLGSSRITVPSRTICFCNSCTDCLIQRAAAFDIRERYAGRIPRIDRRHFDCNPSSRRSSAVVRQHVLKADSTKARYTFHF